MKLDRRLKRAREAAKLRGKEMKRAERLAKGCCPEHGIGFTQLSGWFDEGMPTSYTVVECLRRDCTFRAFAPALPGCEVWDSSRARALERATKAMRLSIGLLAINETTDRQGNPS